MQRAKSSSTVVRKSASLTLINPTIFLLPTLRNPRTDQISQQPLPFRSHYISVRRVDEKFGKSRDFERQCIAYTKAIDSAADTELNVEQRSPEASANEQGQTKRRDRGIEAEGERKEKRRGRGSS